MDCMVANPVLVDARPQSANHTEVRARGKFGWGRGAGRKKLKRRAARDDSSVSSGGPDLTPDEGNQLVQYQGGNGAGATLMNAFLQPLDGYEADSSAARASPEHLTEVITHSAAIHVLHPPLVSRRSVSLVLRTCCVRRVHPSVRLNPHQQYAGSLPSLCARSLPSRLCGERAVSLMMSHAPVQVGTALNSMSLAQDPPNNSTWQSSVQIAEHDPAAAGLGMMPLIPHSNPVRPFPSPLPFPRHVHPPLGRLCRGG